MTRPRRGGIIHFEILRFEIRQSAVSFGLWAEPTLGGARDKDVASGMIRAWERADGAGVAEEDAADRVNVQDLETGPRLSRGPASSPRAIPPR